MLKTIIKTLPAAAIVALLAMACSASDVPALPVPNEPTLVYIYTQP